ncbi:M48 family metallopeptidase [Marinoscillum sp. MHG1-6]|uniref:tetratricopeptide repeat protein n=1 Tax=Marinoscillum sp. MHG1-6 TaxID=2959627 RepID=UPI0021583045|nr:tetratricopeptide repeat protein [Marinoscillum sp. MHG1-6]
MNKSQIILIIVGLVLVAVIYSLPRSVVENDQTSEIAEPVVHSMDVTPADNERITYLRAQLIGLVENKTFINFADSLADMFLKYRMVDSASSYADRILEQGSSLFGQEVAAMIYYRASQNASDENQALKFAGKAREMFENLLKEYPDNLAWKNKLAMTMMTTENPMSGVMMLREVLETDPENREAILNLGLLAIRSGQYERAKERFLNLVEINAEDHEAWFYLGVTYAELGEAEKGLEAFEKYLEFENADEALKATAANYIKELENI